MWSLTRLPLCRTLQKVLSLDMARSLVRLAPTKDEIEMIQQYKGDKDKLGAAEKFFLEMMVIPRLAERLACFVYKGEFATRYEELRIDIKECNVAMHELRTSNKLRRIMEVVLVLGNFMNRAYGYNGQGQGYTTDSLIKLVDTKSTIKVKGRSTYHLLHHLIQVRTPSPPLNNTPRPAHNTPGGLLPARRVLSLSSIWRGSRSSCWGGARRCLTSAMATWSA